MSPHNLPHISATPIDEDEAERGSPSATTAVNTPATHTPRNSHPEVPSASEKDHLSAKEKNEESTVQESGLRLGVQLRGTISHRSERDVGVLERKVMMDIGDGQGLREVIVIDWTPDDPGVSAH
jgi:hypothetical protein